MAVRGIWVPVYPSLQNFGATIVRGASGAARQASGAMTREFRRGGQQSGQAAGEATAAALRAQQSNIERASRQLAGARDAEADAAGAVRVAEAALEQTRNNANATATQIARAEERAEAARRAHNRTVEQVRSSEQQLEQTREGGASANRTVIRAEQQLVQARGAAANANGQVRVAEVALQDLRDRGVTDSARLAAAEERLERARRQAASAADNVRTRTLLLQNAQRQAEDSTDDLGDSQDEAGNSTEGFASRLGALTKQMGGLAAGAAGIAGIGATIAQSFDNEALNDKLAAQLGATPAMAKEFGGIAARIYGQAYGENLGEVNEALKGVWQQGLVDEDASTAQIENVTKSVMNLTSAFDQDLSGATAAVGSMLKNGLAPDAQSAMDILTRGFQQGADKGQDLLDTMTEYPALFKGLGLSGQEAMGLINQAMAAGARNSDFVADALKEFQIRAQDGSKTSATAYQQLGLNAEQMTAKMAAGGQGASEGLDMVLDRLRAMKDPVARNAAAVGLFGTKAEDLGDALFSMDPTTAVKSLGDVTGAAERMGNTLNDNAASRIESFKRTVQNLATTLAGGIIGALTKTAKFVNDNKVAFGALAAAISVFVLPALTQYAIAQARAAGASTWGAITRMAGAWRSMATAMNLSTLATNLQTSAMWRFTASLLANPLTWIVIAVVAAGVALWAFFTKTETGRKLWEKIWGGIKAAVSAVVNWFTQTAWPFMQGVFQKIGDIAMWLWHNAIEPAFNGIKTAIGFVIDHWKIFAGILLVFTGPVGIVIGILGFLQAKFGFVTAAIRVVGSVISWLWNNVAVPAFNGIKAVIGFWWAGVQIYFNAFRAVLSGVGAVIGWLWNNVAVPAFNGIKSVIDFFWSGASVTFGLIKQGIGWIGDKVVEVKDMAVNGFNAMVDFVKGLPGRIANAAKGMWDGFKDAFKSAINWIIDGWNSLQFKLPEIDTHIPGVGKIGGSTIGVPQIPRLATGGVAGVDRRGAVFGPGNGTDDFVLGIDPRTLMATAFVSNGEGVVKEKVMAKGGAAVVAGLNSGQLDPAMLENLPRYAEGGTVGKKRTPEEINNFPRQQGLEGSPYVWGGVHWGDCSGTQSAIARFAVGLDPWGGRFATGNEADALSGFGFKMGQGPAGSLRIGWKNGGPAGGHTAGTLPDGTNVEMGGNRGNGQVGGGAAAWNDSYFDTFAFLEVEPLKSRSETNPYENQKPGADTIPTAPNIDGTTTPGSTTTTGTESDKLPTMGEMVGKAATEQFDDLADFLGFKDTWLYDPNKLDISTGKDKAKESTESPNSGQSVSTATPGSNNTPTTKPKEGADKVQDAPTPAPGASQATVPPSTTQPPKSDKQLVQEQFKPYGWDTGQPWADVDWIVGKESGWRKDAKNPSSGAYGYFQFLGSTKDQYLPQAEPVAADIQGRAGAKYIKDRYTTPAGARAHWEANNWYDRGGVGVGTGLMAKNVLEPERVLSGRQTSAFEDMVEANFSPRVSNGSDVKVAIPTLGDDDNSTSGKRGGRGDAPLVGQLTVQAIDVDDQVRRINRTLRDVAKSDVLLGGWN
ncbi:tape measure protein [Gordonia phage Archimedes]|uniref:Tape measure protein n=1 Tax=Gordonia phage Archimedes TaxID=2759389 RepID=A0A7L7SP41_9CAUD|nr:endolysin [Gordonia phage Archimedes]QOC55714.1 tape measure protein [Gordonia phage Archimedes]